MQKYKVYINNKPKIITDNWEDFCSNYELINAAGGVVYNSKNQLLMIFRNNKWDLPKGKIIPGEDINDCALREVNEECGINNLQIISQSRCTYHTYKSNSKYILKCTHWFDMYSSSSEELIPQFSEGIIKAVWVDKSNIFDKIKGSYGNIIDLLKS